MALPQLVALDVDGTLRNPEAVMTDRTKEAVRAMADAGSTIVIATGRPWMIAERDAVEIECAQWAVCSNGAMNVRLADTVTTRNVFLDDGEPERVVGGLRQAIPGIGLAFEFENGAKSEDGWGHRLPAGIPLGRPVDDVLSLLGGTRGPVRRVIAWHDDYDDKQAAFRQLVADVVGQQLRVEGGGLPFCDVGKPGINKAVALEEICTDLGISSVHVAAFGDEVNDLDMLAWAGTGVAMGNAADDVRSAANHTTVSNAEDGVAVFLENLLENQ